VPGDALVGVSILYNWRPAVGWCMGQIVERKYTDGRLGACSRRLVVTRVKVNFLIFYEIAQQYCEDSVTPG